ncbi:MAG TPA: hypothetical protein GXZ67_01350, partial [Clostridiaceae bacterium]|nr:hypothetical protein [Clostridiaceae bacterium]
MTVIRDIRSRKPLAWLVVLSVVFSLLMPIVVLSGTGSDPSTDMVFSLADEINRRGLSEGDAFGSDGALWVTSDIIPITVTDSDGIHFTGRT